MRKSIPVLVILVLLTVSAGGLDSENDVLCRVVDVGQGLCCIVKIPGDYYIIYDAGSKNSRDAVYHGIARMTELIPPGEDIDLLIVSHNHDDHYNALKYMLCESSGHKVRKLFYTGQSSIRDLVGSEPVDYYSPGNSNETYRLDSGDTFYFGDNDEVAVTVVCGWDSPLTGTDINTTSIVVRLTYAGNSILFTGDSCGYAQRFMAGEEIEGESIADSVDVQSEVLIAPHHGSSHGMIDEFFDAVDPVWVVFPAGHWSNFLHPRTTTVEYFIDTIGVPESHIFRTDWGDDERKYEDDVREWDLGRIEGHEDLPGDDHVDIWLKADGTCEVVWEDQSGHQ